MKVRQSEAVSIVDNYGVGVAYVYSVLNDGGRQQHVVFIVHEVHYDLLEFLGLHLSVTDGHTRVGHILTYHGGKLRQVAYAVVNEIHLSVAAHLKVYCIGYHFLVKGVQLCAYRIAVGRRSLHYTHVARTHQREL